MWTTSTVRVMSPTRRRPERLRPGRTVPRRREHRLRTGRRAVPRLRDAVPTAEDQAGGMLIIDDVHRYLPSRRLPRRRCGRRRLQRPPAWEQAAAALAVAPDMDEQRRIGYGDLREGVGAGPADQARQSHEWTACTTMAATSKNPGWHENDAAWKAAQVLSLLGDRNFRPKSIVDIGCGTGGVLEVIAGALNGTRLVGYDLSAQAIGMVERSDRVELRARDSARRSRTLRPAAQPRRLRACRGLLGFLRSLRPIADWFMFHIPLDTSAQSVVRERPLLAVRSSVGHLHYFTRGTALATLETAGFEIVCRQLLFPQRLPIGGQKPGSPTFRAIWADASGRSCRRESWADPHFSCWLPCGTAWRESGVLQRRQLMTVGGSARLAPTGAGPPCGRRAEPHDVGLGRRSPVGRGGGPWH